jgi:hypothetical protein
LLAGASLVSHAETQGKEVEYRLLATSRMSTMERELNEAAYDGFVLVDARGGMTEHGDEELVAILERDSSVESTATAPYDYVVLATSRTGTMREELHDAARRGFVFVTQTVFHTPFRGEEIIVIMERSPYDGAPVCEYELLATTRTSTMEDEVSEYARKGSSCVAFPWPKPLSADTGSSPSWSVAFRLRVPRLCRPQLAILSRGGASSSGLVERP